MCFLKRVREAVDDAKASLLEKRPLEDLHEALLDAYRLPKDLERMVQFELDMNLFRITTAANLDAIVFDLIVWAEQYGRTNELVQSAYKMNPHNVKLRSLVHEDFSELLP